MMPSNDDELKKIKEENLRLRAEIATMKASRKFSRRLKGWFARHTSNVILGRGLKQSFLTLYNQLPNRVTKDSLADVSSHIVWRVTRIGTLAVLATMIPLLILFVQTIILNAQNDKLDQQNRLIENQNLRLDQQIHIDESTRRSSFIFLMSNIMDKVDEELKLSSNQDRKLSDELIGRIVSLSQSLRPYRYLESDELIPRPMSPERGQLLFALLNSWLDEETYDKIFEKANFNFADLREANFSHAYLRHAKLAFSNFPDAIFNGANLELVDLSNANLDRSHFENTYMSGINLANASLEGAELYFVDAPHASMKNANIRNASISGNFSDINLSGVQFQGTKLGMVELEGAYFRSPISLDSLDHLGLIGAHKLKQNYLVEMDSIFTQNNHLEKIYILKRKIDAPLSIMENCEDAVVQIIRSNPKVRRILSDIQTKGDQIIFIPEVNLYGNEDAHIQKDSIYVFKITSEQTEDFQSLLWVQFDPIHERMFEINADNPTPVLLPMKFNHDLMENLRTECRTPQ